jgi:DNA topoisomerase-1
MIPFARALPRIRRRVQRDLARPGLPREKVLATVVRLLEVTRMRVGNEEYARENESFGLTTLRERQVKVRGATLRFRFRGKSGVEHAFELADRKLAGIVRRMQDLPGEELFQYVDEDGETRGIESADVNAYLREISAEDFTSKDFRTWAGTVLATIALQEFESVDSEAEAKRNVVQAIERVAERLGNTPAICRKCYIHPAVLESYLEGTMLEALRERTRDELTRGLARLQPEEAAVLVLLQHRLTEESCHDQRNGRRKAS